MLRARDIYGNVIFERDIETNGELILRIRGPLPQYPAGQPNTEPADIPRAAGRIRVVGSLATMPIPVIVSGTYQVTGTWGGEALSTENVEGEETDALICVLPGMIAAQYSEYSGITDLPTLVGESVFVNITGRDKSGNDIQPSQYEDSDAFVAVLSGPEPATAGQLVESQSFFYQSLARTGAVDIVATISGIYRVSLVFRREGISVTLLQAGSLSFSPSKEPFALPFECTPETW